MIKEENTEKRENYRLLSIFIDNISKIRLIADQYMEVDCDKYVIIIVRNGVVEMENGGHRSRIKTNEALLIKKERKMVLQGLPGEECWIVMVEFDGSGVSGMLRYLQFSDIAKFNVSGNQMAACLDSMLQTWEGGEYFRAAVMLQTLLITIKDTEKKDYRVSNLNEIYQYIQEHYAEPLDLNHLSRIYGTSVSYFSRTFKEQFGIAPMTFVNQTRLHYAKLFLTTSNMRIQDIALRCGYEKLEYFCYVFKKSEGCTPSQYRANRKYADKIKNRQVLE